MTVIQSSSTRRPADMGVGIFKGFTLFTLATGLCLHGSSLFMTREQFVATIFTPQFDVLFAIPMTIAGLAGVWLYRRAIFTALWQRLVYLFLCAYFLISIVLHIRTWFTWDTRYILAFPSYYPYIAMTLMVLLGAFTIAQRFKPARAT